MAKRRPAGDGMVRRRDDGRWEGRIVIGHRENGEPLFRHVYAKTQKALLDKLHQNIEGTGAHRTRLVLREPAVQPLAQRHAAVLGQLHIPVALDVLV